MKNRTNKSQNPVFVKNNPTPQPISKRKILVSSLFVSSSLLLSACGGGGSSSTTSSDTSSSTLLKQTTLSISIEEGETKKINLLEDGCNADVATSANVKLIENGNVKPLPAIYEVDNINNTLNIDLTSTSIADSTVETDELTLVCENLYGSASGNLNVLKQDIANDSPLIAIFDLPSQLTVREDLTGSIRLSDADIPDSGVLEDSYQFNILDINDNLMANGTMTASESSQSSERRFVITNIDLAGYAEGEYRLVSEPIGTVIGGEENRQDDSVIVSFTFIVNAITDSPTTLEAPELENRTSSTIDVTTGVFADEDGVQSVSVGLYSDIDLNDVLQEREDGLFTGLNASTTYYVAAIGEAKNEVTETFEFKQSAGLEVSTSDLTDSPSTISPPIEDSKTTTSINVTPGSFNDDDGTRNVTVSLYSDFDLATLIETNVEGDFTDLEPSTAYYLAMTGETFNGASETWEAQKSSGLEVTTNDLTDSATTITPPTLDSKTGNSINTTIGSFTDDDGVRNISVGLYSNSGLTSLVASNENGEFSDLSAGTTYYLATIGEAKNGVTGNYESKQSDSITVETDAISSPEISVNDQQIIGRTTSLFFGNSENTAELEAPTVNNVNDDATYSLSSVTPDLPELTINSATGIATYSGNTAPADYEVTITVTNTDTGTASATFVLSVVDN